MNKRKMTNGQTMIYKPLHRKLKNPPTKHGKYVINQQLDHINDISFSKHVFYEISL
jgi:hypothetical protein